MQKPYVTGELKFLAVGEVMAELRRDGNNGFSVGFAGDTYNTAVYCARALNHPGSVGYFTRVGSDPLSADLLEVMRSEQLNVSSIARDQERSIGIYAVSTDDVGERSFSYWRENSAARLMFSNDKSVLTLPPAHITYLSGISLAILSPPARHRLTEHLSYLSRSGKTLVAFDSNYRPSLWESEEAARDTIGRMWEIADIALPSIDDEMDLFNDASEEAVIARFSKRKWQACAIKRGEKGPVSPTLLNHQAPHFQPAPRMVDTTAAGDSFNAGYIAALLAEKSESECLLQGHELASYVVGVPGAIAPVETPHQ